MTENAQFELLSDLAKLLKKHGAKAFEELAEVASKPEFGEQLAVILQATAKSSASPQTKAMVSTGDYRYSLVLLEKTEPEKSSLLVRFYDAFMARIILPTTNHVNSFAMELGIQPLKSGARNRAAQVILDALKEIPLEDIKKKLALVTPVQDNGRDRSLEGWSQLILNSKKRSNEPVLIGQ